jgi:hypothetical protein
MTWYLTYEDPSAKVRKSHFLVQCCFTCYSSHTLLLKSACTNLEVKKKQTHTSTYIEICKMEIVFFSVHLCNFV